MKCPICNLDLSPLDLVSKTEHVDLCIENGPSILEVNETGQLVVKKNLPPNKQRKICPICDKTFTSLTTHFKTCALKHDVPPDLMLSHWDNINTGVKNPKKFPVDLLQSFIKKCIKDGRLGEQVDYARALALSITSEDVQSSMFMDPGIQNEDSTTSASDILTATSSVVSETQLSRQPDVNTVLMQNASSSRQRATGVGPAALGTSKVVTRPKYRIEVTDELNKQANIALRISRELAASRNRRYRHQQRIDAISKSNKDNVDGDGGDDDDAEVAVISDNNECSLVDDDDAIDIWLNRDTSATKLFYRARMKICTNSQACQQAECKDHDLDLMLNGFESYSGAPMNSILKDGPNFIAAQASTSEELEHQTVELESSEPADKSVDVVTNDSPDDGTITSPDEKEGVKENPRIEENPSLASGTRNEAQNQDLPSNASL